MVYTHSSSLRKAVLTFKCTSHSIKIYIYIFFLSYYIVLHIKSECCISFCILLYPPWVRCVRIEYGFVQKYLNVLPISCSHIGHVLSLCSYHQPLEIKLILPCKVIRILILWDYVTQNLFPSTFYAPYHKKKRLCSSCFRMSMKSLIPMLSPIWSYKIV